MGLETRTEKSYYQRKEVTGFTIDGPFSVDLDDALWIEKNDDGYVAHISIADAGAFVPMNSRIDFRALSLGFTRYFSSGGISCPMLPKHLISYYLTLEEGEKRPTITLSVPISEKLEFGEANLEHTYLTSCARLTYEDADRFMQEGNAFSLRDAQTLSKRLLEKRKSDGAFVLFNREKGLAVNEEGNLVSFAKASMHNSYILVQEFMILANQIVAQYFSRNNIPCLYRNHLPGDDAPERSEMLNRLESALASGDTQILRELCKSISSSVCRASYGVDTKGHFGLNLRSYLHFTSPMRRYADLVNNRQLTAHLLGRDLPYNSENLEDIAAHLNGLKQRIKDEETIRYEQRLARRSSEALESDDFSSIKEGQFYKVIQTAIDRSTVTIALESEISSRLEDGLLKNNEILMILSKTPKEDLLWKDIRKRVLDWLEQTPQKTVTIFHNAKISPDLSICENKNFRLSHHTAIASLTLGDEHYQSLPQTAKSKKESSALACFDLLTIIAGFDGKSRGPKEDENVPRKKSRSVPNYASDAAKDVSGKIPDKDYRSMLKAGCIMLGKTAPEFFAYRTGTKKDPTVTVTAQITLEDKVFISYPVVGEKQDLAEQWAAKDLFDKIQSHFDT